MRIFALALPLVAAACSGTAEPVVPTTTASSSGYEVDAADAPAVIDGSWTLRAAGDSFGIFSSAVRCGDVLFLGETQTKIRRLDLLTGGQLPSLGDDRVMPMTLAADCPNRTVWVAGPSPRGKEGLTIAGYDINSGRPTRTIEVHDTLFPTGVGAVIDGELFLGGLWMPTPPQGRRYLLPPASAYYRDKKIGLRVDLASGESHPVLEPFEQPCRGAGACVGAALAPVRDDHASVAWIATLPVSSKLGLYNRAGGLVRTIDAASPSFVSDGFTLDPNTAAEPRMRWSAKNTLMHGVTEFGGMIASVHILIGLPEGWNLGQFARFNSWMNIHSLDGRNLVSDIRLPEMPIGHDDTHLYVVDYGPQGRQGAAESVEVLRIPVKSGLAGFVH